MEYKGRTIPDEVPVIGRESVAVLYGEGATGTITLSAEEFAEFAGKLAKLSDRISCQKDEEVKVIIGLDEGYEGDFGNEPYDASLTVSILTERKETDEERETRISSEKERIDESESIDRETVRKKMENLMREACNWLELIKKETE